MIFEKRYYRTTEVQSLLYNTQEHTGIMQTFCFKFFVGFVLSLLNKTKQTSKRTTNPGVCYFPPSQLIVKVLNFLSISSAAILRHLCQNQTSKMHECIKRAGTRDWAELCSHKQTELLEEQGVGQAHLLPIKCFTRAFLYPPIDAVRCHNIRAETKGAAAESAQMLASTMPIHLLDPKSQPWTQTVGKVCPAIAFSFLKPRYEHSHF